MKKDEQTKTDSDSQQQKAYNSPKLMKYGDFRTLTLSGGATSKADGGGRTTKVGA